MRILFVNYEYPPLGGGGGVIMAQMAEALSARGHYPIVLTSRFRGSSAHEIHKGVEVFRVPVLLRHRLDVATQISMYSFLPSGVWGGLRHLKPDAIDLINTHFAVPSGPTGALLARRWKKPHVLTAHGGDIYDPSKRLSPHRFAPLGWVVRWVLQHSDCVTTDYPDIASRTRSIYGYDGPLEVIPYGLPSLLVPRPCREELGWPKEQVILISVARLIPRKGFTYLVEALSRLKEHHWRWVAVGSGPLHNELIKQAEALGIADRIELKGFVEEKEKHRMLASADVFVLPSLHEGFGVVNLEAMAFGLPIVTTDVGGQTDFLKADRNALLVPPADPGALEEALRRIIEERELRRRLGENNRSDIAPRSFDKMIDRYEQLFEQVVRKAKA